MYYFEKIFNKKKNELITEHKFRSELKLTSYEQTDNY